MSNPFGLSFVHFTSDKRFMIALTSLLVTAQYVTTKHRRHPYIFPGRRRILVPHSGQFKMRGAFALLIAEFQISEHVHSERAALATCARHCKVSGNYKPVDRFVPHISAVRCYAMQKFFQILIAYGTFVSALLYHTHDLDLYACLERLRRVRFQIFFDFILIAGDSDATLNTIFIYLAKSQVNSKVQCPFFCAYFLPPIVLRLTIFFLDLDHFQKRCLIKKLVCALTHGSVNQLLCCKR